MNEININIKYESKLRENRNSSVELFRIFATFLVLLAHFIGWFVGGVSNIHDSSLGLSFRVGQMILESLGVVCVNCFLIISGWYGMKFKFSAIWKLWTIIFFIYVPFQLVLGIYHGQLSILNFINNVLVFTRESYFVQCYAMLLFLSPIINSFFEKYGKQGLSYILAFWILEIILEAIWDNKSIGFEDGYSLIHFVLIYMLARIASFYKDSIVKVKRLYWIVGYFVCAFIICLSHILGYKHTWDYSNPIVVIESFCLFFPFIYNSFYNKWINWIASSTFAVFIMHTCDPLYSILKFADNYILIHFSYCRYLLLCLLLIFLTFVFCIIYDKVKIILFQSLTDRLYNKIDNQLNVWKRNYH